MFDRLARTFIGYHLAVLPECTSVLLFFYLAFLQFCAAENFCSSLSTCLCILVILSFEITFLSDFFQILRPGVLWFLRNLNDPDFHPMQEVGSLIIR